ncbi:hypothetical protein [Thalassovita aquimarina]|uniref:Uncharacterized protein n=1 Tax=Thalassovita aquimarina TaxID=2785917 RepID=A0ABS5HM80_9RHOB|nr:hypothetical protein [Thalassovita aquimarina]MBR9650024.1 hypothetical protein [Thalassovita aquimarina]
MFIDEANSPTDQNAELLALIRSEREKSLSVREWKHRLIGYGYAIRNTDHCDVVSRFGSREELCDVPAELLH